MARNVTYSQLVSAAAAMRSRKGVKTGPGSLLDAVEHVLDCGRVNAGDSIAEGQAVEDFDRIALDTVICTLSERDADPRAAKWFARYGIRA